MKAYEIEQRRLRAAEKDAETTARFQNAQQDVEVAEIGVASGMKVDNLVAEEVEGETEDGEERVQKKMPARKTKAQRNKAARHLAEVRSYFVLGLLVLLMFFSFFAAETRSGRESGKQTDAGDYQRGQDDAPVEGPDPDGA